MKDGRWVTIAESQFAHEKRAWDRRALYPTYTPVPSLGQSEFRDNRGRWHGWTCWSLF